MTWDVKLGKGPSAFSFPGGCASLHVPVHSLPATPFRLALEFLHECSAGGADVQGPAQQWLPWSPLSQIREPAGPH